MFHSVALLGRCTPFKSHHVFGYEANVGSSTTIMMGILLFSDGQIFAAVLIESTIKNLCYRSRRYSEYLQAVPTLNSECPAKNPRIISVFWSLNIITDNSHFFLTAYIRSVSLALRDSALK